MVNEASMMESAASVSSTKLGLDKVNGLFLLFLNQQCLDFESSLKTNSNSTSTSTSTITSSIQMKKPEEVRVVRGAGSPYALEAKISKAKKECKNCGVTEAPMFRRFESDWLCNACGLFLKKNKRHRPPKPSTSTSTSISSNSNAASFFQHQQQQQQLMGQAPTRIENLAAHMLPTRKLRVESVQIQPLPNPVSVTVHDEGYNSRTLSSFWSTMSPATPHYHDDSNLSNFSSAAMSSFSSSSLDSTSSLLLEGLDSSHFQYSNQSI